MASLYTIKEQEILQTPLILFDVALVNGQQYRWSTHPVTYAGHDYSPRIINYGPFHLHLDTDPNLVSNSNLSLVLANTDQALSGAIHPAALKGATIQAVFVLFDLESGLPSDDSKVLFRGVWHAIEEVGEASVRLSFHNRLGIRRSIIPSVPIQERCPWQFPSTSLQRQTAVDGGAAGEYSPLYRCGYSPDIAGGVGNEDTGGPFTSCSFTKADCISRGMFDTDGTDAVTRRFAGVDNFVNIESGVPGPKSAAGGAVIPLVYGTAWVKAPAIRVVSEGRMLKAHVLLSHGPISGVVRVLVNQHIIPVHDDTRNMEATGSYKLVSTGQRSGALDALASDGLVHTPMGGVAYLQVAVPTSITSNSENLNVDVLVQGMLLPRYDTDGEFVDRTYTANPAWVMLDVLRRAGWSNSELDVAAFARAAEYCDTLWDATLPGGQVVALPLRRTHMALEEPRSITELLRGISLATGIFLSYSNDGRMGITVENSLEIQQPAPPAGTNSEALLNDGYPAYEFGDGSDGFSGILRKSNGEPAFRRWSHSTAEAPNRASVEYRDSLAFFSRNSLTLADVDDVLAAGQETSFSLRALGLSNQADALRALRICLGKSIQGNVFVEFETSVRGISLHPGDLITITYPRFGFSRTVFRVLRMTIGVNGATIKLLAQLHNDAWYTDSTSLGQNTAYPGGSPNGLPRPIAGTVFSPDGSTEFLIEQQAIAGVDGSISLALEVAFSFPSGVAVSTMKGPTFSSERISLSGATLSAGATYYYGIAAVDSAGNMSRLSRVDAVSVPPSSTNSAARLFNLSFDSAAATFNVYGGLDPSRLFLIAGNLALSTEFVDTGDDDPQPFTAPDEAYDHSNFYFREELLPPTAVTSASGTYVGMGTASLVVNQFAGRVARLLGVRGAGQERTVVSNTTSTITITPPWSLTPDTTSVFCVADSNWQIACSTVASPARFEIPNREGSTLHVTGRAANSANGESSGGLAPVTRITVTEGSGVLTDSSSPPEPLFAVATGSQGTVTLLGISFSTLTNTHTISSGTLTLYSWDELTYPVGRALSASVDMDDTVFGITGSVTAGNLFQIGREIIRVNSVVTGSTYDVTRGVFGSAVAAHSSGDLCYLLDASTSVVALQPGIFGTPAAGSFSYSAFLPDARIAAGTFYVTNLLGYSPVHEQAYTATSDYGLRTLSGGQYTIQSSGFLAIQSSAAPPLFIDESHAVRDIRATVTEAPDGEDIDMEVRVDGAFYCSLTIVDGNTASSTVDGRTLPPLIGGSLLTVDVISVPTALADSPGRDLTVTIRL